MILDWLGREGGMLVSWWALVTLAGLAALPLLWRVLGSLPDRGYAFARAAGLLLVAFVFWLLASLGFLRNSTDSMALAWGIVLITGLSVYLSGKRIDLRAYWRENRASIITTELLFAGLFILWAVVRAHQNGLTATEKPMELAFISSSMRSDFFPPNDPWLAGYAISYYYFGYVMAAMLALLSGAPGTMAFNLMIALLFALTGVTVFGIGYNLVRANALSRLRARSDAPGGAPKLLAQPGQRAAVLTGLLATVLVVVIGNFQAPLIEVPYNYGASTEYLQLFDSNERNEQRLGAPATDLGSWEYWWFFRAARVLNDRNLDGSRVEVIDEFPQFSFLLADVHPHVLSLPFAALAVGIALSILLSRRGPNGVQTIFYAVVIGGLIFLNTWDGPIYLAVLLGAEALRRLIANGRGRLGWGDIGSLALMAVTLIGLAVLFYLPFLLSFRSQLGGVLPNFLYPTSFAQFFVMFGPLLLLIAGFLIAEAWRGGRRMNWRAGLLTALGILGLLVAALLVFVIVGALSPDVGRTALGFVDANGGWGAVLPELLTKRLTYGLTALLLLAGLAVIVARLFPRRATTPADAGGPLITFSHSTGFALLLVAAGVVLTLTPEFIYLRDNFGTRMNTVFKFYYQAWLLWGVAAAYGVYNVLAEARAPQIHPVWRAAYRVVAAACIALGMVYPVAGVLWRTQYETGRANGIDTPLTLDGIASVASADDLAAIECLSQLVQGGNVVVAERIGNSYDIDNPPSGLAGRIAGLPNVMNWPGHQGQWRGTTYTEATGTRQQDMDILYGQTDWAAVQDVIRRYGIDYIVFGSAERQKYGAGADIKFRDRLALVCEFGGSRVYSTLTGN